MQKKSENLPSNGMSTLEFVIPVGYKNFLESIKSRIFSSQVKAAVRINEELIDLYWEIGGQIAERQEKEGWGSQVIEKLAKDLQNAFPGVGGFSRANVFKMRAFYLAYKEVSQAVRQIKDLPFFRIPWGHNVILLTKLKEENERDIHKPMGVAGYEVKIMESLPKNLKGSLPSIEEFEAGLKDE